MPHVPPLIEQIFDSRHYEGNGPPTWREGKNQRPCKTAEEAEDERHKLIKRLLKHQHAFPSAFPLAERLEACNRGDRCMSGACPECLRIAQRWFVVSAEAHFDDHGAPIGVLSLVPSTIHVPTGKLTTNRLLQAQKDLKAAVTEAGITNVIGGFDYSANEHERGKFRPHYKPQVWCLGPADQIEKAASKLREIYPWNETTKRPVKTYDWDRDLRALSYAVKGEFTRRISYQREASDDGLRRSCSNTRDRPLTVEQHIELLITLDQMGLHERLLLRGARIVRTSRGPMIRPIT